MTSTCSRERQNTIVWMPSRIHGAAIRRPSRSELRRMPSWRSTSGGL